MTRISATQAARNFSDVINRAHYRHEEFVVERGGEELCRIVPAGVRGCKGARLAEVLRRFASPDKGFAQDVQKAVRAQPKLPSSPW